MKLTKFTSLNLHLLWEEVSPLLLLSQSDDTIDPSLAILRPKFESEISIQDRHPTCKFY